MEISKWYENTRFSVDVLRAALLRPVWHSSSERKLRTMLRLVKFWNDLQSGWCSMMHPDPTWPINGHYRCARCNRRIGSHCPIAAASVRPAKSFLAARTASARMRESVMVLFIGPPKPPALSDPANRWRHAEGGVTKTATLTTSSILRKQC
jgi:hypothetical protein